MSLPSPPFRALTRSGLAVMVERTDGPKQLLGRCFPLVGEFVGPYALTGMSGKRRTWQADGRFALDAEDPMDLVHIVVAETTTPFPNTPAELTQQPAASMRESQTQGTEMSKTINGIALAALTAVQATIIKQARTAAPGKRDAGADERKQIKREVYSIAKAKFGIPESQRVSAIVSNPDNPEYLVLHTGGKKRGPKLAFRLNSEGKWDGTYVTKDQLFPPPAPAAQSTTGSGSDGSVFGGAQSGGWFRLDPAQVAAALTLDHSAFDDEFDTDKVQNDSPLGAGVALPTPHLMLAGRTDLAITADGSIYRKV